MKNFLLLLLATWITAPSYFTHKDSKRITQHTQIAPVYAPSHGKYERRVYRWTRSRNGTNRLYVIERWHD